MAGVLGPMPRDSPRIHLTVNGLGADMPVRIISNRRQDYRLITVRRYYGTVSHHT